MNRYLKLQQEIYALTQELRDDPPSDKILVAGSHLGMTKQRTIVMGDDDEGDALLDYMLYLKNLPENLPNYAIFAKEKSLDRDAEKMKLFEIMERSFFDLFYFDGENLTHVFTQDQYPLLCGQEMLPKLEENEALAMRLYPVDNGYIFHPEILRIEAKHLRIVLSRTTPAYQKLHRRDPEARLSQREMLSLIIMARASTSDLLVKKKKKRSLAR